MLPDDFDISRSKYIVHEGAQAYLQRDAPSVYERYSGIAEVVATVVIGLVSALFGGLRLYKMRRKNRIDTFYVRTIALQRSISEQISHDDRQRIAGEVRNFDAKDYFEQKKDVKKFDTFVHYAVAAAHFAVERSGLTGLADGQKVSFDIEALLENFDALMEAIKRNRPSAAKGTYMKKIAVSTTMGPGIKVDPSSRVTVKAA